MYRKIDKYNILTFIRDQKMIEAHGLLTVIIGTWRRGLAIENCKEERK